MFPDERSSNEIDFYVESFMHMQRKNSGCNETLQQVFRVRSSHQRCSIKKAVLRNFTKFTRKHLRQSLFFNKVAGLRHACVPVKFVKFLRTSFLQNTSGGLLLSSTSG